MPARKHKDLTDTLSASLFDFVNEEPAGKEEGYRYSLPSIMRVGIDIPPMFYGYDRTDTRAGAFRFGTVCYDAPLSKKQLEQYAMQPANDAAEEAAENAEKAAGEAEEAQKAAAEAKREAEEAKKESAEAEKAKKEAEKTRKTEQEKEKTEEKQHPETDSKKIADSGRKLFAKKDAYTRYRNAMRMAETEDICKKPLSKSWPAPPYQKLLNDGMEGWKVAAVRALRETIPTKPSGWRAYKVDHWAEMVTNRRNLALSILDGKTEQQEFLYAFHVEYLDPENHPDWTSQTDPYALKYDGYDSELIKLENLYHMYAVSDHQANLSGYQVVRVEDEKSQINGKLVLMPMDSSRSAWYLYGEPENVFETLEDAVSEIPHRIQKRKEARADAKAASIARAKQEYEHPTFHACSYSRSKEGCVCIADPVKPGSKRMTYIDIFRLYEPPEGQSKPYFEDYKKAQDFIQNYPDICEEAYWQFRRRQEAEREKNGGEENTSPVTLPDEREKTDGKREGSTEPSRGSRNVTQEEFMETYGLSGVTWGNWVTQEERQDFLNRAYDAFEDLARVTKLPKDAMGLGYELGIMFGANGDGGRRSAAAHYEPGQIAINLTKEHGAGSLAHEWFHALDNAFARIRTHGSITARYMTSENDIEWNHSEHLDLSDLKITRHEINQAFGSIDKSMEGTFFTRCQRNDRGAKKEYWGTRVEMAARSFEAYVQDKLKEEGISNRFLVSFRTPGSWDASLNTDAKEYFKKNSSYPYPVDEERKKMNAAFDGLFGAIRTKKVEHGTALYSASDHESLPKDLEHMQIVYDGLTDAQKEIRDFSERVLGQKVAFYEGSPKLHGFYDPSRDCICLNRKAKTDLSWTFWHEAFHSMKAQEPELYRDILQYTEQAGTFTQKQMDAYRASIHAPHMTDRLVREEMLADAFADRQSGKRIVKEMGARKPKLFERLAGYASHLASHLRQFLKREDHPKAGITDAQFSAFSERLDDLLLSAKDKKHQALYTPGTPRLLGESDPRLSFEPKESSLPAYMPEGTTDAGQKDFDIRIAGKLLKEYPVEIVRECIRKNSPQGRNSHYLRDVLQQARAVPKAAARAQ